MIAFFFHEILSKDTKTTIDDLALKPYKSVSGRHKPFQQFPKKRGKEQANAVDII